MRSREAYEGFFVSRREDEKPSTAYENLAGFI